MRCSNTSCGVEGPGKFCHECGSKMVEKAETVVICNGKLEDGSPCHSELVPGLKFCMNCGMKVDPALFNIQQDLCSKCNTPLVPGKPFCGECGEKCTTQSELAHPFAIDCPTLHVLSCPYDLYSISKNKSQYDYLEHTLF